MKEQDVERVVRDYFKEEYISKGWKLPKVAAKLKAIGQHGADILLYNSKYGGYITIEVKGYSNKLEQNYNAFYSLFGQILSRINTIPAEGYASKKKFVIAAPKEFVLFMHKLIHNIKNNKKNGMIGGWSLFGKATNLHVWAVDMKSRKVIEYNWKDLLKNKI
jgi:hypothetical protein